MRTAWLVLPLWLAGLSLPGPTHAQDTGESLDARDAAAREAFAAGRYQDAVELFAKLYAEHPHPNYLHNVGRCYMNLGDAERAIASFREFLRKTENLAPEVEAQVEGYIAEMEKLRASTSAGLSGEAAHAPRDDAVRTEHPRHPNITPSDAIQGGPQPAYRRPLAWSFLVTGIVAAGVGTFYGVRSLLSYDDAEQRCPTHRACSSGAIDDREQAERYAWISNTTVISGAALAITGGVLLFKWARSEKSVASGKPSASLHVVQHGLSLRGSF